MSDFACFRRAFVFKRTSGSNVKGKWVKGPEVDVNITASLHPLSGEDLRQLPEGRRTDQTYKLYTSMLLNTVTADANPDYTMITGSKYEVILVAPSENGVINHYKAIIGKVNLTNEL